jgi:glycosyltransferase involved in cell wall biosynthesis
MKICIICSRLSFGGAERVAVAWANGFSQKGHEVMVISNLYDPITYQLDEKIAIRHLVPTNQNKFRKWLGAFGKVRRHLKEFRPKVVIGVLPTCSFVARIASLGLHIPVVATEHDSFERPKSAPFSFMDKVLKFGLNRIYRNVTVLTKADKDVIATGLSHVQIMPNPLALKPLLSIPSKSQVILAAGRLDAWHYKGFDNLIRAWGQVNEELKIDNGKSSSIIEPWKLQIAGTGSEESLNYLKKLCKENVVEDSVDFLGFQKNIEKLYQEASIFVLSSRYEGFGLVLIEAMSQGCACVACDYKGRQREIIQNDSQGLCCEPEDVEALSEAIKKMIMDNKYRESIRLNAIERSKFYSIENTIERWEKYLTQISS